MGLRIYDLAGWQASGHAGSGLDLARLGEAEAVVREICARIRREGDAAVREYTARWDGWAGEVKLPVEEMEAAAGRLDPQTTAALRLAAERIEAYHRLQTYQPEVGRGGLRLLTRPLRRCGIYVPGGRAAYPSTVLMAAIPARLAGVSEIALATPPAPDGSVPDTVLAAARIAGVTEIHRMGGAQAVAALAYGTRSIPRVDIVVGPGNIYVTLAKKEVFGAVAIDSLAGPTEIAVVADATADPRLVAADLASQLEHDPQTIGVLFTDSPTLADAVAEAFTTITREAERRQVVEAATCCLVVTPSLGSAIDAANHFAPEHLQISVADPQPLLARVENAGAVFVGRNAPTSLGDYTIGTNHVLPTSGSARFSSPLGVHTFLKRMSVATVDDAEFAAIAGPASRLARMEGLPGHAYAIDLRGAS